MKQTWKHFFGFYLPLLIIMTISLFVMYHARIISPLYSKNFFKQSKPLSFYTNSDCGLYFSIYCNIWYWTWYRNCI